MKLRVIETPHPTGEPSVTTVDEETGGEKFCIYNGGEPSPVSPEHQRLIAKCVNEHDELVQEVDNLRTAGTKLVDKINEITMSSLAASRASELSANEVITLLRRALLRVQEEC